MYLINEHDGINKYAGLIFFCLLYKKRLLLHKRIQAGMGGGTQKLISKAAKLLNIHESI